MMIGEEYFITFGDIQFFFKETIYEITPPSTMASIDKHRNLSETHTLQAWWPY